MIQFTATLHNTNYWSRHPDVQSVEVAPVGEGEAARVQITIKLKADAGDEPNWPTTVRPQRQPDVELFGEGAPDDDFLSRCPDLEASELFIEPMPDETCPKGWWAMKLWFGASS